MHFAKTHHLGEGKEGSLFFSLTGFDLTNRKICRFCPCVYPQLIQFQSYNKAKENCTVKGTNSVWPDWAIYWTLDNFLKPLATINLPKSPTFLGIFCKGVKIYHFLVKSFFGNFYRHLAIFFWSHWMCVGACKSMRDKQSVSIVNTNSLFRKL